ncbi:MAG: hypothetical protein EXS37_17310 [Opitutus sp.]|nr:hypothetical protein [Opitutus sp.]
MDDSTNYNQLQKPLDHFRPKTKRLKVHPTEIAALWIVCTHFVLLPWCLGTMRTWAQVPSLVVAVVGLVVALLPRSYTEEHTNSSAFRLIMWPKLLKFPIFWIGFALMAYVVAQALNPAWTYKPDGNFFRMEAMPHTSWLPTGVEAPYESWNQFKMLVIFGSAWLSACTVWVAFTRRRTLQIFLTTLAVNGLLLALFGISQRMFGNGKIFWFFVSPNPAFFSSFIYKNHGSAYLDLILAVTCGLGGWYYLRGLRRMEKSNPSGVFAFFATCIAVAVLTSYARGATLIMLAFLLVCIVAFVIHQVLLPSGSRKPVVAVVLVLVFGCFLKTGMDALKTGEAWNRIMAAVTREDMSLEIREVATKAATEMLQDTWASGVGAGSFRFLFPAYQKRHAKLWPNESERLFWDHAHNDVVQFPIELGAVGMGLVLFGFGYYLVALVRSYFWASPLSACVVFGLLLTIVYSWWDFPFQCVAILSTWCALWPAALMWARFEESGARS